jgi:transposase-like protein
MGKRSEVPVNERRQAVLSLLRREEPAAVIARRCGVAEATFYRWRDDFLAAGEAALARGTQTGAAHATDGSPSSNVRSKAEIKSSAS